MISRKFGTELKVYFPSVTNDNLNGQRIIVVLRVETIARKDAVIAILYYNLRSLY